MFIHVSDVQIETYKILEITRYVIYFTLNPKISYKLVQEHKIFQDLMIIYSISLRFMNSKKCIHSRK